MKKGKYIQHKTLQIMLKTLNRKVTQCHSKGPQLQARKTF